MIINQTGHNLLGGQARVRLGDDEMETLRRLLRDYDYTIAHTEMKTRLGTARILREVDEDGTVWLGWSVDVIGE